jgi:hypothetical protein
MQPIGKDVKDFVLAHVTQSFFNAKYCWVKSVCFGNRKGFQNIFSLKTEL